MNNNINMRVIIIIIVNNNKITANVFYVFPDVIGFAVISFI